MNFYYVGGYVRDKILGVENKDIDFAVEAESYEQMRDYIAANGTIFLEKPEFFTIRAMMTLDGKRQAADFVLCRKESGYTDGRHPDKVEVGTIYDDLARRDFTMNAMAIKAGTGELIDPFNGQKDIKYNRIKCVNNPQDRFLEDPLRILRALRFSVTKKMILGHEIHNFLLFEYDSVGFKGVSLERKREELHKMFTFNTLETLNILEQYRHIRDDLFTNGLWLMPTNKEK